MRRNIKQKSNNVSNNLLRGSLLNLLYSLPILLGGYIILTAKGPLNSHVLSFGCFVVGLSGIIVIVRKEYPMSFGSITGKSAILLGTVFTLIFWGMSLYLWIFNPL